jgi:hypothetical protein
MDIAFLLSRATAKSVKVVDSEEKGHYCWAVSGRSPDAPMNYDLWLGFGGPDEVYAVDVPERSHRIYSKNDIESARSLLEEVAPDKRYGVLMELKRINPGLESLLRGNDPARCALSP